MPPPGAEAWAQAPGTALVRHAPVFNAGTVEGSVHQMLGESTTLSSGAVVTGNLLVPGTPAVRLNGRPVYGGTLDGSGDPSPANYQVTLNGNARLGHVVRRTDAIPMPAVGAPPAPAGTRSITIASPDQDAGDFATLRNLTLTGRAGEVAIPPGTYGDFVATGGGVFILGVPGAAQPAVYHFQRLTLKGQAQLQVAGPVVITVGGGFTANHSVGSPEHWEWLTLNLHSGGLTLNGGASFHGTVNAPGGTVAVNGKSRLVGGVASDRLILNGGLLRLVAPVVVPYFTGFEPADGFAVGPLSGQGGWVAGDGATITSLLSFGGSQSILVAPSEPPVQASQAFTSSGVHTIVFADIFARPAAGATPADSTLFETGVAEITCTQAGTDGLVLVFDGGTTWQSTGFKIPVSAEGEALDWVRFTVRENFAARTWDLYADGRLIAFDLSFADSNTTAFSRFSLIGATAGATVVDDFFVGFDNPLFTDADRDGMEDAWETAHGLDPVVNDRNADRDADGLSNIREYLLGLHPDKVSTFEDGISDALRVSLGLSLTGPTIDTIPPTAPTGVTATVTGLNVLLMWTAATDNIGIAGYLVSRDGELPGTGATGATNFADVVPDYGAIYTYAVRAVDFAGNQSSPGFVQVDIPAPDADGNGLPDEWEWSQFGSLGLDPDADPDGDGIANIVEFQNGTDPRDFFNGLTPILEAPYGGFPAQGGFLELLVLKPDGTPWINAPVTFEITSGHNRLSAAPDGLMFRPWVEVRSDADGLARAYLETRP